MVQDCTKTKGTRDAEGLCYSRRAEIAKVISKHFMVALLGIAADNRSNVAVLRRNVMVGARKFVSLKKII